MAREDKRVARTFKLPPELVARVEARAAMLGMTRTAFLQGALEAALGAAPAPPPRHRAAPAPAPPPLDPAQARAEAFRRRAARQG